MAADRSGACWRCARPLNAEDFTRGTLCPGCRSETRCCRNCALHSPMHNNQCREPQADTIADKEKSNFCEFFRPKPAGPASAEASRERSADQKAKAAFDALFKKKK